MLRADTPALVVAEELYWRVPLILAFPDIGACLLYTSDAADERSSVDLGGRRIIKKKTPESSSRGLIEYTIKPNIIATRN